jgi:hypothetical protein
MKRLSSLIALGMMAVTLASPASAQKVSLLVGAGPTFPMGDFGDFAKTGWLASVGARTSLTTLPVLIGLELLYGSNSHSDVDGDKTNLPGALLNVSYRLGDPAGPGAFLIGSVGAISHQYRSESFPDLEGSETDVAFGVGAGIEYPMSSLVLFVMARYLTRDGTNFIPVQVGVAIPIGKSE